MSIVPSVWADAEPPAFQLQATIPFPLPLTIALVPRVNPSESNDFTELV